MPTYPGSANVVSSPGPVVQLAAGIPAYLIGTPATTLTQLPPMKSADVVAEAFIAGQSSIACQFRGGEDFPSIVPNIGIEFEFSAKSRGFYDCDSRS